MSVFFFWTSFSLQISWFYQSSFHLCVFQNVCFRVAMFFFRGPFFLKKLTKIKVVNIGERWLLIVFWKIKIEYYKIFYKFEWNLRMKLRKDTKKLVLLLSAWYCYFTAKFLTGWKISFYIKISPILLKTILTVFLLDIWLNSRAFY